MKGAFVSPVMRSLPILLLTLALAACDGDEGDSLAEFRGALPDLIALDIAVPGESDAVTSGGLSVTSGALLGQPSTLREATGRARQFLLGTIGELLASYQDIIASPPARRTRSRVAWWRRIANDSEVLVVMSREGDGHFTLTSWIREGHDRDPGASWRFFVYGNLTPARTLGDGRGALYIDLDNDLKLRTRGKVVVLYSAVGATRDIDILTYAATLEGDLAVTRGFRYHEQAQGGSLAFDAGLINVHVRPDHGGLERVKVITRWNAFDKVRSDFTAMSDEVAGDGFRALAGTECWHAGDGTVLYDAVRGIRAVGSPVVIRPDQGDIGACPSDRPAIPVLPMPGDAPSEPAPPPETDPSQIWER